MPLEASHEWSSEGRVTGSCEPPEVGTGNRTWVLCKNTKCYYPLSCVSSPADKCNNKWRRVTKFSRELAERCCYNQLEIKMLQNADSMHVPYWLICAKELLWLRCDFHHQSLYLKWVASIMALGVGICHRNYCLSSPAGLVLSMDNISRESVILKQCYFICLLPPSCARVPCQHEVCTRSWTDANTMFLAFQNHESK